MNSDEQAIRAMVATWLNATKAGDTQTVLSLLTEDVVLLAPGGEPMRGRATFEAAAQAQAASKVRFDGTIEIQEIGILGDWAFMWTRLTVVTTVPGQEQSTTRAGHTLSILKKENGNWLLARDANTLTPVTDTKEMQ